MSKIASDAFGNIDMNPAGQLSRSVQQWAAEGNVYSWDQYQFSGEFRDQVLAPIYNRFATGQIDKQEFIDLMTQAFVVALTNALKQF